MVKGWAVRGVLLVLMLLPLGGCPYSSEVAIDDGSRAPFDEALVGEWQPVNEKDQSARLTVVRLNAHEYAMVTTAQDEKPGMMRAFISEVGGVRLLNVEELTADGSKGFSFFRYAVGPDGALEASAVSDDVVKQKFAASAALRAYLQAHLKDEKLFEEPMRFVRPAPPASAPVPPPAPAASGK